MFNNKRYNSYFDYRYYHTYLLVEESDIMLDENYIF